MTTQIIRSTGNAYHEAVAWLIIHESEVDEDPEKNQAMVTRDAFRDNQGNRNKEKKCYHCDQTVTCQRLIFKSEKKNV